MNIFVLDLDPWKAAEQQCDQHINKMSLETAQILNVNSLVLGGGSYDRGNPKGPYKRTHVNHKCTVWARESLGNFEWLFIHGLALCAEYSKRYKKVHACQAAIEWVAEHGEFPHNGDRTPFVLCMPNEYKMEDPVESYRRFYQGSKAKFARYYHSDPPKWLKGVKTRKSSV